MARMPEMGDYEKNPVGKAVQLGTCISLPLMAACDTNQAQAAVSEDADTEHSGCFGE